jgi:hypothetical protein
MLIIEDPPMAGKYRTAIKALLLYFYLCLGVKLDNLFLLRGLGLWCLTPLQFIAWSNLG